MGEVVKVIGSRSEKNFARNGQFDWFGRRGGSPSWSNEGNLYTADGWFRFKQTGGGPGVFTNIQDAGLANGSRSLKIGRTAGSSDVNQTEIIQAMESKDVAPLKGQQVTLSFKVRKGADFSGTGGVNFYLGYGTGTDQGVVAAWTGQGQFNGTVIPAASLSTSLYYQAKLTVTLPSNVNQLRYDINYVPTGTAGANDWIEITEVMLNLGGFVPYIRHGFTELGEERVMQRYYWKTFGRYTTPGANFDGTLSLASDATTNKHWGTLYYPTEMRVGPVLTFINPQTGTSDSTNVFTNVIWDGPAATSRDMNVYASTNRSAAFHTSGTSNAGSTLYTQLTADAEL